jgi:hypothetical protein
VSIEDDAQKIREATTPWEQGKALGDFYLPLFTHDLSLDSWMAFGEVVAPAHLEGEQDCKAFLFGWQIAWEDRDLLIEILSDEDQVIAECTRLFDRRKLVVERQVFRRARLCFGSKEWDGGYDTTYDYATPDAALDAMQRALTGATEPTGWQRHPGTGRYRINGDARLEYVKDHDCWNIEQNIAYALQATQGFDRTIAQVIPDNTLNLGGEFIEGAQCFFVTSETPNDANGVSVSWVFHYQDRSVVLKEDEIYEASKQNVARRLMGA